MRPRVLALVDGEHYPQVVRAALEQASATADVVAALLLGGTEKLAGAPDYGVPLETLSGDAASSMLEAAARHGADRVLDLSDEPVLSEKRRLWLAANALAAGLAYEGADFELRPPAAEPLDAPGAGDRRHRQAGRQDGGLGARGAAAACGRPRGGGGCDGPRRPGRAGAGGAVGRTRSASSSCWRAREPGMHAASDFLEDAVLTGCRHRRRAPLRRRPVGRHVPLERGRGGPAGAGRSTPI